MPFRKILLVVLGLLFIATIFFLRFRGIEDRPLARDEYYSATAVQRVLEHGVPRFYEGGYYPRALPLQYVTAQVCRVMGESEASHRVIPVLFSVLSIPLLFALARFFVPTSVAVALAFAFGVSSWETEFGRFARMYTALQFIFLMFFYAFYRAYRLNETKWRYVPHLMCCAAISLHTLGALLLPFLFAPAIALRDGPTGAKLAISKGLVAAGALTALFVVGWLKLMGFLWDRGVENAYPEGYVPLAKAGVLEKLQVSFGLPGGGGIWVAVVFFALLGLVWLVILFRRKFDLIRTEVELALATALVAAVFHQLALAGIAIGFLVWRHDFLTRVWKKPSWLVSAGLVGVIAIGWLAFSMIQPAFLSTTGASSKSEALRECFFGFPDIYRPFLSPWMKWVPLLTLLIGLGTVVEVIRIRKQPWDQLLWHPLWVIVFFALVYGFVPTDISTTRYWFVLYPILLLISAMGIFHGVAYLVRKWNPDSPLAEAVGPVVFAGLFLLADDFHLRPLTHPGDPDVVFRAGRYLKLSDHWYPRSDERTPALALNSKVKAGETVVISSLLTASAYYFEKGVRPIMFMPRDVDPRFRRHSRARGTINNWNGFPLAASEEELRKMTAGRDTLYFARLLDPANQKTPEEVWGVRLLSSERVGISKDGRVETLKLSLGDP